MSDLAIMKRYEELGDGLKGRPALSAYVRAQNAVMSPPTTKSQAADWARIQSKIMKVLEQLETSDSRRGCGTSPLKKIKSAINGKKGGHPKKKESL